MQLIAILFILNIQLSQIFASPPSPLKLPSKAEQDLKGYECGNVFFTDAEVKDVLSIALNSLDQGYEHPQVYRDQLYSESKLEEYFLYPIRKGQQYLPYIKDLRSVFRVVFKRNSNKEVDVVAKVTSGDYTRCIRRDGTQIGPSHLVPKNANGFLCAHKFLNDLTIRDSLVIAQTNVEGNHKYPSAYIGELYPKHSGHLVWPIMKDKTLYRHGEAKPGPYHLILNNRRQFVEVVIKGYSNNYLRCLRSRKPPKAPTSDPYSKLFVQPPKAGYVCDKHFFDLGILNENAAIIKSKAGNAKKGRYPIEFTGPPFHQRCLIWPLLQDGSLFKIGTRGPYRLVLTPDYKVMSVAMLVGEKYKICERNMIKAKKNHDPSDYQCFEERISHQQLAEAAEEACVKMTVVTSNFFPARYSRPGFDLGEPYFTYPVFQKGFFGEFSSNTGPHRALINRNCEVVGALTTLKIRNQDGDLNNNIQKKLVRCHRLDDGPVPPEFFGPDAEAVFEQ